MSKGTYQYYPTPQVLDGSAFMRKRSAVREVAAPVRGLPAGGGAALVAGSAQLQRDGGATRTAREDQIQVGADETAGVGADAMPEDGQLAPTRGPGLHRVQTVGAAAWRASTAATPAPTGPGAAMADFHSASGRICDSSMSMTGMPWSTR